MACCMLDYAQQHFQWYPRMGFGHFPVSDNVYDQSYFDKYVGYSKTEIGRRLNWFRTKIVRAFIGSSPVLDIGIGCGTFMEQHGNASGFDVNPAAVEYLKQKKCFVDPYVEDVHAFGGITFWDSLEHISNPGQLLARIDYQHVFVSIPIFRDVDDVLSSKHYREDEHCWYFTFDGFLTFMEFHGFQVIHHCTDETDIGRESIQTFVFKRSRESAA